MNTAIEQAIELIQLSHRIAALSGAGISTEAGIPDFRGPGGLWDDPELMALMSASGFRRDAAAFYRAALKLFPNLTNAQPTTAHRFLAHLEEQGKVIGVITQNIDGLHQMAGSKNVFEIHGTFRTGHCTRCGALCDMMPLYADLERAGSLPPLCTKCGGTIKPDVVLFEDIPPPDVFREAVRVAQQCDLLLVMGSSLLVYPAADLPGIALDCGARLVIVNLEETDYDPLATVVVRARLGDFAHAALAKT